MNTAQYEMPAVVRHVVAGAVAALIAGAVVLLVRHGETLLLDLAAFGGAIFAFSVGVDEVRCAALRSQQSQPE